MKTNIVELNPLILPDPTMDPAAQAVLRAIDLITLQRGYLDRVVSRLPIGDLAELILRQPEYERYVPSQLTKLFDELVRFDYLQVVAIGKIYHATQRLAARYVTRQELDDILSGKFHPQTTSP